MTLGRAPTGKFLSGTGGCQAGARKKMILQAAFIEAQHEDFAEHGPAVIKIVRIEQPDVYLKVTASVLPKELVLAEEQPLECMSDEELLQALATIKQLRAAEKQPPPP